MWRRQREQITRAIESIGGQVKEILSAGQDHARRKADHRRHGVLFISREGDLRHVSYERAPAQAEADQVPFAVNGH